MATNLFDFGRVAVLMGGHSSERAVSLMSGAGVLQALLNQGIDAHAFDPAEQPIQNLESAGFSRCFIALHGRFGEDGTVQGALELMGIPYTGSGVMASSIAIDKVMTKRLLVADGLPTPRHVFLRKGEYDKTKLEEAVQSLGLPFIVKPSREGSSLGLSKVCALSELQAAIEKAELLDADILCEQWIDGDEVTCPIIVKNGVAQALPLVRIMAPEGNYDYQNKYFTDSTQYQVPANLPINEEADIAKIVLRAFHLIGCRGWARADVMIDCITRKPYLLEINTAPGMTGHSLMPMSARAAGFSYEALCLQILKTAARDYPSGQGYP